MTGLFKCVVLSCAVSLVFGYMSVRDDANWFKNGQRIKNRFVTGVVNGIVDFDCNDTLRGENIEGECMSKVECTKADGKLGGLCSLLGSCCVIERTCRQTTSSKISYFVPPKGGKLETECPLTINVYSKDVCQIRLDFLKFNIAQPTSQMKKDVNASYQCHDDSFQVLNVNNLGFLHLCGKNDGQHIYIPVGENQQKILLSFFFKNRTGLNLPTPDWRIKIRQLECRKSGYEHLLNAPSKLMAMYNSLKNKKNPKNDKDWIAPDKCLQYYRNRTGTFESFNYNDGKGHYIGHMHYAICFEQTHETCSARFRSAGVFQMNQNKNQPDDEMQDPCRPGFESSSSSSDDYIRIPGGINLENRRKDYYCDRLFDNNNTVTTRLVGPFSVEVHTDGNLPNSDVDEDEINDYEEIGFKLNYELLSGNCDVRF